MQKFRHIWKTQILCISTYKSKKYCFKSTADSSPVRAVKSMSVWTIGSISGCPCLVIRTMCSPREGSLQFFKGHGTFKFLSKDKSQRNEMRSKSYSVRKRDYWLPYVIKRRSKVTEYLKHEGNQGTYEKMLQIKRENIITSLLWWQE